MGENTERPTSTIITQSSIFDKGLIVWQEIKESVTSLAVENLHLEEDKPLLGERDDVIAFRNIEEAFLDPKSVAVILRDRSNNSLIGYTLAMPIDRMDPNRASEGKETAYIYHAVVAEPYRGQGMVGRLTDPLFLELDRQGFLYVERDSMIANGYADNVEKNSKGSIVKSYDHDRFGLGQERFFRINIQQYLNQKSLG